MSQPHTPRVSVLMPVYNAEPFLPRAIDSILAQTFADFELICVDDGSTDGSLAVLRAYQARDERVRILSRPNTGIVGALNDGLAAARGERIARMDADDWCDPTRFAKQVAYLDAHPRCVAVGTWCTRTDPYGSPAGSQEPPTDHATIDAGLLRGQGGDLIHATLMMRASTLRAIGGWDTKYNWVEDLDLFLRLTEAGEVANIPEHLYTYRRHLGSVCATRYESMYAMFREVVRDAHVRRGLPVPDLAALRPEMPEKSSVAEQYRSWACHAVHQRAPRLAVRHAWSALRREPINRSSWRVMRWALQCVVSVALGPPREERPTFYAQHGEDVLAWKVFRNSRGPRFFLEVGIIDGLRFSNTYALEQRGWRGVCVEAHPTYAPIAMRNRPGSVVVHAAAGDQPGVLPFYADPRGDLSSLVKRDEDTMKARFGHWYRGFQVVEVPVLTLDEVLREADAPRNMEVVSIDIEGAEVAALRGFALAYWRPRVLILETDDAEARARLDAELIPRGYRFARQVGVNAFYARSRLDAWRLRLTRIDRQVFHPAHPNEPEYGDRVVLPSGYENRRTFAKRVATSMLRAA